jgi:hypothetical protein
MNGDSAVQSQGYEVTLAISARIELRSSSSSRSVRES